MSKSKREKCQGLKINVKKGLLTISVGIETLGFAAVLKSDNEYCDDDGKYMPYFLIKNSQIFAKDIAKALNKEDSEDGFTQLHRLLDDAATEAVEDGSLGVVTHDDGKAVKLACESFDCQQHKTAFYKRLP